MRQRLSPQLLHEDSICESNEKEQRPARHVQKNGAAVLCRNSNHSPTERRPHCCTTITITICGSTPFIVLFFLLLLLLILPLPFLDDNDHCIHPPNSKLYKNNNSDSVVDKHPCRSNNSKPVDTSSKQERNVHKSSSNRPTPFRSPAYPKTTQTL